MLEYLRVPEGLTVVHGACPKGADFLVSKWISKEDTTIIEEKYPADWKLFGHTAGFMRNEGMAKLGADLCIAFWDGISKGTLHMISQATKYEIPVRVVPMKLRVVKP